VHPGTGEAAVRRGHYRLLAALVAVVAVVVAGSVVRPSGRVLRTSSGTSAPVTRSTAVCPNVTGGPGGLVTDMFVAHLTSGPAPTVGYLPVRTPHGRVHPLTPRPVAVVQQSTPYTAVAVTASGPGSEAVVAGQTGLIPFGIGRSLIDTACLPPAGDWWFVGTDGRIGFSDYLFLINPTDAIANVALSFTSSRGALSPPNTTGIPIAAHTTVLRRVSDFAPDVAGLSIHVHANSGSLAAAIGDLQYQGTTPRGGDWIAPTTPPARTAVVTGFFHGATEDVLDVANPGDRDATVSLRVLTPSKNFVPAGHPTVVVPAGHTLAVDLSGAIAGEAAAVTMSSDQPVVAAGLAAQAPSTGFRELTWLPAQRPMSAPAGIANMVAPFGQRLDLLLTAPEAPARVRLTTANGAATVVSVRGGRTIDVDLAAEQRSGKLGSGPLLLTPLDPAPVYAMRTMYALGAHGPLVASSAPVVLPRPTSLPPVVADVRAALA
jgi:hypothetical protein